MKLNNAPKSKHLIALTDAAFHAYTGGKKFSLMYG